MFKIKRNMTRRRSERGKIKVQNHEKRTDKRYQKLGQAPLTLR